MTDQSSADQVSRILETGPGESLEQAAQQLDSLIQTFEQHPIVQVRDQVMEMLSLIDGLHRQGLQRLVEALKTQGPELLDQVLADPAVHLLLMLYDLLPPGPREQVEMALGAIGPYIASLGGSLEVLDVIDGVVHLHLSGSGNGFTDARAALQHDIEEALRAGFPGFRSIEVREQVEVPAPAGTAKFIPLQQIRTIKRPVFTPVAPVESLPPGTLKGVEAEGVRVLLCNLDGEIYAYRNACPGSILPLDTAQLKDYTLLCPWHNCVYDIRTGKRLDQDSARLQVIPAAVRDGMIQLALNVESAELRVPQIPGTPGGRGS
jgi:nitrite reductase/ring-hydroxylating ferredoxin subunit/Fe-S cluster biogenesis protein NfuA